MGYPAGGESFKYKGKVWESRTQRLLEVFDVPGDGKCFFHSVVCCPSLFIYNADSFKRELNARMTEGLSLGGELGSTITRIYQVMHGNHVAPIEQYLREVLPHPNHWGGTFEAAMIRLLFNLEVGLIDSFGTTMASTLISMVTGSTSNNAAGSQPLPTLFILHHDVSSPVDVYDRLDHLSCNHWMFATADSAHPTTYIRGKATYNKYNASKRQEAKLQKRQTKAKYHTYNTSTKEAKLQK